MSKYISSGAFGKSTVAVIAMREFTVADVGDIVTPGLAATTGATGIIVKNANSPENNSNVAVAIEASLVSFLRSCIIFS